MVGANLALSRPRIVMKPVNSCRASFWDTSTSKPRCALLACTERNPAARVNYVSKSRYFRRGLTLKGFVAPNCWLCVPFHLRKLCQKHFWCPNFALAICAYSLDNSKNNSNSVVSLQCSLLAHWFFSRVCEFLFSG
jgi:hypothetical protein